MSQQLSKNIEEPEDAAIEDDPLAELARIVSAGSIFGSISEAFPYAEKSRRDAPEARDDVLKDQQGQSISAAQVHYLNDDALHRQDADGSGMSENSAPDPADDFVDARAAMRAGDAEDTEPVNPVISAEEALMDLDAAMVLAVETPAREDLPHAATELQGDDERQADAEFEAAARAEAAHEAEVQAQAQREAQAIAQAQREAQAIARAEREAQAAALAELEAQAALAELEAQDEPAFLKPAAEAIAVSKSVPDDFESTLDAQLEAELLSELQNEPARYAKEADETIEDVDLDELVTELATPASAAVSAPHPAPPQNHPPLHVASSVYGANDLSASAVDTDDQEAILDASDEMIRGAPQFMHEESSEATVADRESSAEKIAGMAGDAPASSFASTHAAIEEALNLDSFFDSEFAAAAGNIKRAAHPPAVDDFKDIVTRKTDDNSRTRNKTASAPPSHNEETSPISFEHEDIDPLDTIFLDSENEEFSFEADERETPRRGKILLAFAAVLMIGVVGAAGAYFLSEISTEEDTDIVVAADPSPVRVKPSDPGGKEIPNQDRTVYETIIAPEVIKENSEALVDRSETLVVGGGEGPVREAPRVILPGPNNNTPVSATRPPQGPRTVRTVVVRPDGTIVADPQTDVKQGASSETIANARVIDRNSQPLERESASAQPITPLPEESSEATPASAPDLEPAIANLPTVEETSNQIIPRVVETRVIPASPLPEAAEAIEEAEPAPASESTSGEAEEAPPAGSSEPLKVAALTPLPRVNSLRTATATRNERESAASDEIARQINARPTELRPNILPEEVKKPAAAPQPDVATPAPLVSGGGNFVVQLSSQRTEEDALRTFAQLQRRFSLLSGYSAIIQRADLGSRGVYHRLQVGRFATRADAIRLCEDLKAAGGDCIVNVN